MSNDVSNGTATLGSGATNGATVPGTGATTEFETNGREVRARTAPIDAGGFVAEAERISNATNVQEALGIYAPDALLESVTDGTLLVHRGSELGPAI